MPVVSVIIPCFNSANLMKKCLEMFEKQTFKNFEIIIVDDCSTDNSLSILEKETKNRNLEIKVLRHYVNAGPGIARNTGISAAQGEFFAFCDCDDYYAENYLEVMYDKVISTNSDIVMCNCMLVMPDSTFRDNSYTEIFNKNNTKEYYLAYSRTALCYLLVRRSLFDSVKLPPLYNGEDMAVVPLLLLKAKKITHVEEPLYFYCVRKGSASNKATEEAFENIKAVFKYLEYGWSGRYENELEFLGIKTILYSAVMVGIKAGVSNKTINETITSFESKYKIWNHNPYLKGMAFRYRVFLRSIQFRQLWFNRIYAKLHTRILGGGNDNGA